MLPSRSYLPIYTRNTTALGRIACVMKGRHKADVLLYYPIETLRRHHRPSDMQFGSYDEWERRIKDELWKIMNTLLHYQIDFDFVDGDTLSRMERGEEGILIGANGEEYSALILPPMEKTPDMLKLFEGVSRTVKLIIFDDVSSLTEAL